MNRFVRSLRLAAWTLVALAALVSSASAGSRRPLDDFWSHPELARLHPGAIALLPAVGFVDDPPAMRLVEQAWMRRHSRSGDRWRPPSEAAAVMAGAARPDSLHRAVARQVRAAGRVDSATAATLARLMRVEAVLTIRVDRWEVVNGARGMVEMTAALVDSSGRLLWMISGAAGHGPTSRANSFGAPVPVYGHVGGSRLDPGRLTVLNSASLREYVRHLPGPASRGSAELESAMDDLLERWDRLLAPGPMFAASPAGSDAVAVR